VAHQRDDSICNAKAADTHSSSDSDYKQAHFFFFFVFCGQKIPISPPAMTFLFAKKSFDIDNQSKYWLYVCCKAVRFHPLRAMSKKLFAGGAAVGGVQGAVAMEHEKKHAMSESMSACWVAPGNRTTFSMPKKSERLVDVTAIVDSAPIPLQHNTTTVAGDKIIITNRHIPPAAHAAVGHHLSGRHQELAAKSAKMTLIGHVQQEFDEATSPAGAPDGAFSPALMATETVMRGTIEIARSCAETTVILRELAQELRQLPHAAPAKLAVALPTSTSVSSALRDGQLAVCVYGAQCYRGCPRHNRTNWHPPNRPKISCKWGEHCRETDPWHNGFYAHPQA
jgi:hypothetical protein